MSINFKSEKLVNFSAKFIFDLVMDIEKYPEFLPWCKSTKIVVTLDERLLAEMKVGFGIFADRYNSDVVFGYNDGVFTIKSVAIDGPMSHLENIWNIQKISDEESLIKLNINFKFSNKLFNKVVEKFLDHISQTIMESFLNRAKLLYKNSL